MLLGLLEESPAHGYELMRALEARSGGFYAPSPGMIYPALAYLDDAGEIAAEAQGARKRYSLTPAGLQRLDADRELVAAIMEGLSRIGSRMEEVRDAFAGLHDLDPAIAHELHEARRKLKRALFAKRGCAPEEARRVAAVLTRAAAEIAAP